MSTLLILTATGLFAASPAPKDPGPEAKRKLASFRRSAVGAVAGWSHAGLAIRHFWTPRFASGLAAYASFGQRFGLYSLSARGLHSYPLLSELKIYALAPIRWTYALEPTHRESNFGADPQVNRIHKLRAGLGPGAELFFGPHISFVAELPIVLQWSWSSLTPPIAPSPPTFTYLPAPNLGFYVYFR